MTDSQLFLSPYPIWWQGFYADTFLDFDVRIQEVKMSQEPNQTWKYAQEESFYSFYHHVTYESLTTSSS